MVFVKDDVSEYAFPLEKIWKYWQTHKINDHKCVSNPSWAVIENGFISTYEYHQEGVVVKIKFKGTFYPPLGIMMEYLEGSTLAGSRVFQYFIPNGGKTRVVVVGDVVFPKDMPPDKMQSVAVALDAMGEKMFQEDSEALARLP